MFLKAILLYTRFANKYDTRFILIIEKIYNHLMNNEIKQDNITDFKDNVISLENFRKKKENFFNQEFAASLVSYLEFILLQEHHKAFDNLKIKHNFEEMRNVFSGTEIRKTIKFFAEQLSIQSLE